MEFYWSDSLSGIGIILIIILGLTRGAFIVLLISLMIGIFGDNKVELEKDGKIIHTTIKEFVENPKKVIKSAKDARPEKEQQIIRSD